MNEITGSLQRPLITAKDALSFSLYFHPTSSKDSSILGSISSKALIDSNKEKDGAQIISPVPSELAAARHSYSSEWRGRRGDMGLEKGMVRGKTHGREERTRTARRCQQSQ